MKGRPSTPGTTLIPLAWQRSLASLAGLDADEGAALVGLVPALGHRVDDLAHGQADAVELFRDDVETDVADRLEEVLALDPERFVVVPRRPLEVLAIAELLVVVELT